MLRFKTLGIKLTVIRNKISTLFYFQFNIPNSNEPVNIEGHFKQEPRSLETDIKLRKGQQNVLISGSLKGNDFEADFKNTLNPYINFKATGHIENDQNVNTLTIIYPHRL